VGSLERLRVLVVAVEVADVWRVKKVDEMRV
jgi:hypothetical protein